jgi:hypothetical protein
VAGVSSEQYAFDIPELSQKLPGAISRTVVDHKDAYEVALHFQNLSESDLQIVDRIPVDDNDLGRTRLGAT